MFNLPGYLCVVVRLAVRYVEVCCERDLPLLLRQGWAAFLVAASLEHQLLIADGALDGWRWFDGGACCDWRVSVEDCSAGRCSGVLVVAVSAWRCLVDDHGASARGGGGGG